LASASDLTKTTPIKGTKTERAVIVSNDFTGNFEQKED
jgi:hypothetical protein